MWYKVNMIDSKDLIPAARADLYVGHLLSNKYNRLKAHMITMDCSYDNSMGHSWEYHNSDVVQEALRRIYDSLTDDSFKCDAGLRHQMTKLFKQADHGDLKRKILNDVHKMNHYQATLEAGKHTTNVLNLDSGTLLSLKTILGELKTVSSELKLDNGRQDGKVKAAEPRIVRDYRPDPENHTPGTEQGTDGGSA